MRLDKTALAKTLPSTRLGSHCMRFSFALCLSLALPSHAFAAADYDAIPQPLRQLLCSNHQQKEQEYVDRITKVLRTSRNPDVLDQEDINIAQNRTLTAMRAGQVSKVLYADYNGDGKATREELIQKELYTKKLINSNAPSAIAGQPNTPESKADEAMQLDINKDGFIDYDEMRNVDAKFASIVTGARGLQLNALLELSPDKQKLTKAELEKQARGAFAIVDLNHDAILTSDECVAYKDVMRGKVPAQKLEDLKGIDLPQEYLDSLRVRGETK